MDLHERMGREIVWKSRSEPGIGEGVDVENAAFGRPRGLPDSIRSGYVSFDKAMTWVKEHQPALQFRPKIASDLRRMTAEYCRDKGTPVKFFTAIGTPLDVYHGVDAFVEQGGCIVTLDISMREKEIMKADVLIVASMDKEGRVTVSEEEMRSAAEHIAQKLNTPERRAA